MEPKTSQSYAKTGQILKDHPPLQKPAASVGNVIDTPLEVLEENQDKNILVDTALEAKKQKEMRDLGADDTVAEVEEATQLRNTL
ncbi:hypothetical protein [Legionella sp. km772]|uniref:hypothetical protein n=1 Tax=Legionella sp. km772 TaxID=2498111 RepID=UPI000F8DAEF7|nr:hypothetical protein [Legionella sp. km772]RUR09066.1 hypothetical protein ELY15_09710 [Legionella sp. km772]